MKNSKEPPKGSPEKRLLKAYRAVKKRLLKKKAIEEKSGKK